MRKLYAAMAAVACVLGLASCKSKTYEIACVTDVGQLQDGGFNQGTYEGVKNYAEKVGKTYNYYAPANGANATDEDRIAAMELAIEKGAKVIVTPGFLQENALKAVVPAHPEVKFVFVDGWNMGFENLTAICYKEEQSGFLAGYGAVMEGYTKLGGTFGGAGSNPACNRFAYGYVQGADAAARALGKTVDVKVSFRYGNSFSASPELQTQMTQWFDSGIEVVFSCGGSMLQSVKAAAEAKTGKAIIGVDVDQAGESELILTSAFKGLSVSVEKVLGQIDDGKWDAELKDITQNLGVESNATGLPTAEGSWRFKNWTVAQYTEVYNKVKDGTITIETEGCTREGGIDDADFIAGLNNLLPNCNLVLDK